jgi:hypothetical protein
MGVLGKMVVNFTANVQGLQSGIINAEEAVKDLDRIIQAVDMVCNSILDMSKRRKRQSNRRMRVAQKRLEQGKDVLRRRSHDPQRNAHTHRTIRTTVNIMLST